MNLQLRIIPILILLTVGSTSVGAQGQSPATDASGSTNPVLPRVSVIKDRDLGVDMLPSELVRSVEKKISVTDAEKAAHARLRKAARMKMLKMFSAPKCASDRLAIDVSSDECTAAVDLIRASFYSLRVSLYGETIADIRILDDTLMAGNGGFVHGMILDLGRYDLESLNEKSEVVKSLFEMPVALTTEDEGRQRKELISGLPFGESTVSSSKALSEGNVYLIRLISYDFKRGDRPIFNRDQVYVLKYVGADRERIALMLWKRVADRPAPRL